MSSDTQELTVSACPVVRLRCAFSFTPLERNITLYWGGLGFWIRHQVTWLRVYRAEAERDPDRLAIEFKPRRGRLRRRYVPTPLPEAVILSGWHHPETTPRWLLKKDEPTLAWSDEGSPVKGDPEGIFDNYLRSLPSGEILTCSPSLSRL